MPEDLEGRRAAWERLKEMEPIPVPDDPEELDREAEEMF